MVKIHQHVKFQANPSMHSPANARKPLRTDGRTCCKTVTVGRLDQRTHVQVKRGYFRLRTDGRTDGQPENIMPPAPKGGGIKMSNHYNWNCFCPACRTTLVATRFRVAVICPIIQVPHCIRVFFYFVWFVFINHIFQFYYELCTYCNILDIYLS